MVTFSHGNIYINVSRQAVIKQLIVADIFTMECRRKSQGGTESDIKYLSDDESLSKAYT